MDTNVKPLTAVRSEEAAPRTARVSEVRLRHRTVHGYRLAFRMAGSGAPVLLIHGIGDSSETWSDVIPGLAQSYRVIAPDLIGHGASAKPRTDYSLPTYANMLRDLLTVLGLERVTLVGHSLGGAAAMQFAYQYPDRVDRLVLVSTGGVGREVTPLLRAAALPGAQLALAALRLPFTRWTVNFAIRLLQVLDNGLAIDAEHILDAVNSPLDATSRAAYVRTLRAVVDWRGQVGTMLDRCYLAQGMPTLLVWGERDEVVPPLHGGLAHVAMPGSRLVYFEDTGHFPHHSHPQRFVSLVHEFISSTAPASFSHEQWRQMLRIRRTTERPGEVTLAAAPAAG
ncbi:MAG TPA: alpha/beta hydrolase [Jatrophihabitantaceae bacterium]